MTLAEKEPAMFSRRDPAALLLVIVASWLSVVAAQSRPGPATGGGASQPAASHTPWGDPDFQGGSWNFATMTPLERPRGIEKPVLTEAEAADFERQTARRQTETTNNGYDWWDEGSRHLDRRRTSLIVDPADGHVPPVVPAAASRSTPPGQAARGPARGPEDF